MDKVAYTMRRFEIRTANLSSATSYLYGVFSVYGPAVRLGTLRQEEGAWPVAIELVGPDADRVYRDLIRRLAGGVLRVAAE